MRYGYGFLEPSALTASGPLDGTDWPGGNGEGAILAPMLGRLGSPHAEVVEMLPSKLPRKRGGKDC